MCMVLNNMLGCLVTDLKAKRSYLTILSRIPLAVLHNLSKPFLFRTRRESSVRDSVTLKSQRPLTSKYTMSCFLAYDRASSKPICLLKARCNLFPSKIFGTPGAC